MYVIKMMLEFEIKYFIYFSFLISLKVTSTYSLYF